MSPPRWELVTWFADTGVPGLTGLALPVALRSGPRSWVLFATARDGTGRSHGLMFTLEVDGCGGDSYRLGPGRVVLEPGWPLAFDESGVVITDARLLPSGDFSLLVHGWRLRAGGGWWNAIGVVTLDASGAVIQRDPMPAMPSSVEDFASQGYGHWVSDALGGGIVHNSAVGWDADRSLPTSYVVRQRQAVDAAESVLVYEPVEGFAATRPWTGCIAGTRHLIVSERGDRYRVIGRPVDDGFVPIGDPWILAPTGDAGVKEATCYASLLPAASVDALLANGDGYGATGFGIWHRATDDGASDG